MNKENFCNFISALRKELIWLDRLERVVGIQEDPYGPLNDMLDSIISEFTVEPNDDMYEKIYDIQAEIDPKQIYDELCEASNNGKY